MFNLTVRLTTSFKSNFFSLSLLHCLRLQHLTSGVLPPRNSRSFLSYPHDPSADDLIMSLSSPMTCNQSKQNRRLQDSVIWPLPTSVISSSTIFPYTSQATLAFLLSWEHPGIILPLYLCICSFLCLEYSSHEITLWFVSSLLADLCQVSVPHRGLSFPPHIKKHSPHSISFGELIIACHCIICCVVYWLIISYPLG